MIVVSCVIVTLYNTGVQRYRHNVLSFRKINQSRRCRRVPTYLRHYRVLCGRNVKEDVGDIAHVRVNRCAITDARAPRSPVDVARSAATVPPNPGRIRVKTARTVIRRHAVATRRPDRGRPYLCNSPCNRGRGRLGIAKRKRRRPPLYVFLRCRR